jgi:hypothetical protein
MHFSLQINADSAISAYHLVRADAGSGRHVPAWISKVNVSGIVANSMLGAIKRRGSKLAQKRLA